MLVLLASAWVTHVHAEEADAAAPAVSADAGTPIEAVPPPLAAAPVPPPTAAEPAPPPTAAASPSTPAAPPQLDLETAPRESADVAPPLPASTYFGARGLVLSADTRVALSSTRFSSGDRTAGDAEVAVGADVFLAHGFSLGLELDIARHQFDTDVLSGPSNPGGFGPTDTVTSITTRGGLRLGFALPLDRSLSLFPRLVVGMQHTALRRDGELSTPLAGFASSQVSSTRDGPWLSLYIPLLWHIEPDFFLAFGPSLFHDFASSQGPLAPGGPSTRLAGTFEVGGVLFGPKHTDEPCRDAAHANGFSKRGSVLISGAMQLSGTVEWRSGAGVTHDAIAILPALDWFFSEHVSFGAVVGYTNESDSEFSDNAKIVTRSHAFVVAPRFGFDAVLGRGISVYSQLGLGMYFTGGSTQTRTTGTSSSDFKHMNVQLTSYVLAHPVGHLFLGFGPALAYDLAANGDGDFGMTFAINSIVGAWF